MSGKLSFGNGPRFGTGVAFGAKAKAKAKAAKESKSLEGLSEAEREHAEAYRQRAKNEAKRFQDATDTEFWLCFCFPDEAMLSRWREAMGFGDLHRIYSSREVENRFDGLGSASRLNFGSGIKSGGLNFDKIPDPLADVEYGGGLEADCLAEIEALRQCFEAATTPAKLIEPTDSATWFAIAWPDRDAKDKFLADHGLSKIGDKYLDGVAVAKKLGVSLHDSSGS